MYKFLVFAISVLFSFSSFAVDMDAVDYNQSRAIALVDAKLLGLDMDRYRIILDKEAANGNNIIVGVLAPGGECSVLVKFLNNGVVIVSDKVCQPGS